jgi:hypothetical protein
MLWRQVRRGLSWEIAVWCCGGCCGGLAGRVRFGSVVEGEVGAELRGCGTVL